MVFARYRQTRAVSVRYESCKDQTVLWACSLGFGDEEGLKGTLKI